MPSRKPPGTRVQLSGPRVRTALAVSGLSLRDAVLALKHEGVRLSVAGLGKIAAAKGTVTTRKSVRDAIAGIAGVASDWIGGFGPDMSPIELIAHRVAGGFWDEDVKLKAPPMKGDGVAGSVRRLIEHMDQLAQNRTRRARALAEILDLERWARLLGDPQAAEIPEEVKEKFAFSLGQALSFAITRPIKGRPGEFRPRSRGLESLRECLNKAMGENS
jgi:hypothetical protein